MPSALDISLEYGIPIAKVRDLAKYGLTFWDSAIEIDAAFKRAAHEIRYNRIAPFSLAYILRLRKDGGPEADQIESALLGFASKDYGSELERRLAAIDTETIWQELLPDGRAVIDKAFLQNTAANRALAHWCKARLDQSTGDKTHDYLAVRLLLSVPAEVMPDYPRPIIQVLNRMRSRKLLDGYWHKGKDGKTIYHAANSPLDL